MPDPADWTFGNGGFAKLYGDRLAQSSLLDTAVATRWVFIFILAQADAEGRYRCASVAGLARAASVTLKDAERAVRELEAPDLDSTSKEYDGRRLLRIPGGWRVANYARYRDYRSRRQILDADRQQRHRSRQRDMSRDITVTSAPDVRRKTLEKELLQEESRQPDKENGQPPAVSNVDLAKFNRAFHATFERRASLPPDKARTFAARLAAGYPIEFLVGLPVAARAAGLAKDREFQPEFLLRDGSRTYSRNGETRQMFDWIGSLWQAADRLKFTPEQAELLREVGALDWWVTNGATLAQPTEDRTW